MLNENPRSKLNKLKKKLSTNLKRKQTKKQSKFKSKKIVKNMKNVKIVYFVKNKIQQLKKLFKQQHVMSIFQRFYSDLAAISNNLTVKFIINVLTL